MNLEIEKPTLLLDRVRMRRNIERMAAKADRAGAVLRPHFKTHQSAAIGEEFRPFGVTAITVSSLDMAGDFAAAGWGDITIAFPVNPRQIEGINQLASRVRLHLLVEDRETVKLLDAGLDSPVDLWIKIDTGSGRTGLSSDDPEAVRALAQGIADSKRLALQGLLTHAGHTYKGGSPEEVKTIYRASLEAMGRVREALERAGLTGLRISVGDTPGCSLVEDLGGVDEIRPGNFVFYDAMQWKLGSCAQEDIAVAVACPVVARHPERNELVVHGGAVHLSLSYLPGDRDAPIYGFLAADAEGDSGGGASERSGGWGPIIEGAVVRSLSQEHGVIRTRSELLERTPVGALVNVIPVHSCLTVNLMREYRTLEGETIPCCPAPFDRNR
jgi:D-serine deaminase-like pyridoxal phosphate-dependent protein